MIGKAVMIGANGPVEARDVSALKPANGSVEASCIGSRSPISGAWADGLLFHIFGTHGLHDFQRISG